MWVVPQKGSPECPGDRSNRTTTLERTVITVKKLIALLLLAAFVCVGTVGCGGDTKSTSGTKAAETKTK
jgi:hypothetical protein